MKNTEKIKSSYRETIGETGHSILKKIIGQSAHVIYCPSMEIENEIITSPSFSLKIKGEWINFSNSWLETSNDISYYRLVVASSDIPEGIKYDSVSNTLDQPVSSLLFNRGVNGYTIEKIEIYSKNELWDGENVYYDFALVLIFNNDFRLCISSREDVTDQLECTIDANAIERLKQNCELREVLN